MKRYIIIFSLIFVSVSLKASPVFSLANEAYQKKDFVQAINLYKESLKTSQSFAQHFNLGNAYYEGKEYGRAILHYKKALVLEPHSTATIQNLHKAYSKLQMQPEKPTSLEVFAQIFSANTWSWICIGVVVIGCGLFYSQIYLSQGNPIIRMSGWICVFLMMPLIAINIYFTREINTGIVLKNETALRVSPTSMSPTTGILMEGTKGKAIKTKEKINDYILVKSDSKEGWIGVEDFGMIWD